MRQKQIGIVLTFTAGLIGSALACSQSPLHEVTITARDYAFNVPDTLPAGLTVLHFVNRGTVPHEMQFFRFNRGVSPATARRYLAAGAVPDSAADAAGSVLIATPGDSVREGILVRLEKGERYALLCQFHDSASKPSHTQFGMVGLIEVR